MRHRWSDEIEFKRVVLDVEDRSCSVCSRFTHVCDHRRRHVYTLQGGLFLINRLQHCPDKGCEGSRKTVSPEVEIAIALPGWAIGWDLFAWIGHRRFARHWSVRQIREELADTYKVRLSDDAVEDYVHRYQTMVAARQQDLVRLAKEYEGVDSLLLSIDGLQPEKGHETLYAVRELRRRQVWFAESLISSSEDEVRRLVVRAKEIAEHLGKRVAGWASDKQDAFVKAIEAEFPGVPHRYCRNHFLRDLAEPMLEKDGKAKVQMRRKVRGLRAIEKELLAEQADLSASKAQAGQASNDPQSPDRSRSKPPGLGRHAAAGVPDSAAQVALDYCSAVRGILNDNQGGPLSPPGVRMAEALKDVRRSLQRSVGAKKGGPRPGRSNGSLPASTAASRRCKRSRRRSAKS